jgi:hypothetical protein
VQYSKVEIFDVVIRGTGIDRSSACIGVKLSGD